MLQSGMMQQILAEQGNDDGGSEPIDGTDQQESADKENTNLKNIN